MADKGAYTLCEWLVCCYNETVLYAFTETVDSADYLKLFISGSVDKKGNRLLIQIVGCF